MAIITYYLNYRTKNICKQTNKKNSVRNLKSVGCGNKLKKKHAKKRQLDNFRHDNLSAKCMI